MEDLNKKHSGKKNSHYGTCWITKDGNSISIKKELLDQYLADGWLKGRKIKNTENIKKSNANRWWIHNDNGDVKFIQKQELQKYLEDGWKRGRNDNSKIYGHKDKKEHYTPWLGNVLVEINGHRQYISVNDPRYLSGEVQSFNKGKIAVKDKEGNKFFINVNDPRYLSGELIPQNQFIKNKQLCHDEKWNYFLLDKNDKRILSGELLKSTTGLKYSDETRKKMRLHIKQYINSCFGGHRCRYSKKACIYIDSLNEKYGWQLQHAENGGEIEVDGYFLDGYDKKLNIAFEYDERKHYKDVENNILKEKDLYRQNYIINQLQCDFYRYNETTKKLYKI